MARLFGTDGVRGIANKELTAELAFKLGKAGAYVLTNETRHTPRILVGKDTRISGSMLEAALVSGICSVGAEAIILGVIPTPAVAYLVRKYNADAGVVISASHNPFEFNGIKFFNSKGYKLSDELEDRIEMIVKSGVEGLPVPVGEGVGTSSIMNTTLEDYVDFLKSTIDVDLKGIKIMVDCANGAAYKAAPRTFLELGADVTVINDTPDGLNINKECGSLHLESLCEKVRAVGADIGIAFDGDADRVLAVDENGEIVDGDKIMAVIGLDLKKAGRLAGDTIVATVMSNMGFEIFTKENNIKLVRTKVGDRYVLEEMLENGYVIGGEQSGHIILLEHNTTGDGILTALQLLRILKLTGRKLSELSSIVQILPQVIRNAKVSNEKKHKYLEDEVIARVCKELEAEFSNKGRVLIRPSGTEPLIRVMIEGSNIDYISEKAEELVKVIENRLS
ncbi:MAG TPA: phosphoglucosamine mutase [Clostridiaceae bacterium]|nr:phosphoglucosamine mutase [Clostridiaceae bacterium]